jgi:aconitate hydratase
MSLAGSLSFNPTTDFLQDASGERFKLIGPNEEIWDELPRAGFDSGVNTYVPPSTDGSKIEVKISPTSQRLQLLVCNYHESEME